MNIKILRVICGKLKESQIKYYNPMAVKNTSAGKYVILGLLLVVIVIFLIGIGVCLYKHNKKNKINKNKINKKDVS